jgi:hypothetical protein
MDSLYFFIILYQLYQIDLIFFLQTFLKYFLKLKLIYIIRFKCFKTYLYCVNYLIKYVFKSLNLNLIILFIFKFEFIINFLLFLILFTTQSINIQPMLCRPFSIICDSFTLYIFSWFWLTVETIKVLIKICWTGRWLFIINFHLFEKIYNLYIYL